jgi:hypothetical protein
MRWRIVRFLSGVWLECRADRQIESDTVYCGDRAVAIVQVDGVEQPVCLHHLMRLPGKAAIP